MDIDKWQTRLETTFTKNGVVGYYLLDVIKAEEKYQSEVIETYKGYYALIDSFLSFFVETLILAGKQFKDKAITQDTGLYWHFLLTQTTNFRSFRASENLLLRGYPLSGVALLRDLKDRAIIIAAIANDITTYSKVNALGLFNNQTNHDPESILKIFKEIKKQRKKEERKVFNFMIGYKSELSNEYRKELESWQELFNYEVHGGRLTSTFTGLPWTKGEISLPILPVFIHEFNAMYMNRSQEIAWMLLRTLPLLQLEPKIFRENWKVKWLVLDESFKDTIENMKHQGDKLTASAILELVELKFHFKPEITHYTEGKIQKE